MMPRGSLVLLDTVALIYFLEENERYSIKIAEAVFARIESGALQRADDRIAIRPDPDSIQWIYYRVIDERDEQALFNSNSGAGV